MFLFAISTISYKLIFVFSSIFLGVTIVVASYAFFKAFQQRGYKKTGYLKWLYKDDKKYMIRLTNISLLSFFAYLTFSFLFSAFNKVLVRYLGLCIFVFFMIYFRFSQENKADRQNLDYTSRMKRLIVTTSIVASAIAYLILFFMRKFLNAVSNTVWEYIGFSPVIFISFLMPVLVIIADRINYPIEEYKRRKYKKLCKDRLSTNKDLITIGITGSYGKTTVKNIIGTILREKYSVLITPQSYNTPMGISKSVLSGYTGQEIFVCEMGARRKGDIAEICKFIPVDIGLITSVSRQHIESFKNFDNILDTKYELAENIKENGVMFFSADNDGSVTLYNRYDKEKFLVGISGQYGIKVDDIKVTSGGSTFNLEIDEKKVFCKTVLLGEHNISNIVLAAGVAKFLGLTIEEIQKGIEKLQPISHRLQLVPNDKGINIIDDSYNANPHGVKAALKVLSLFEGRKFVITSGLIELKNLEKYENKKLGENLAKVADEVLLVGEQRAKPIIEGLTAGGFDKKNIHIYSHIVEAANSIKETCVVGDTVLFLNDLPDTYLK